MASVVGQPLPVCGVWGGEGDGGQAGLVAQQQAQHLTLPHQLSPKTASDPACKFNILVKTFML